MKKYLPLIILAAGLVVVLVVFLLIRGKAGSDGDINDDESVEVALEKRPVVSLTPTADGHYLNLKITKLSGLSASTLALEFLYKVPGQDQPQGSAPTIDIKGKDLLETDLLLGTESSGKFRYDQGVKEGTITLRFKNENSKLVAKFVTDFSLLTNTPSLSLPNGDFKIDVSGAPNDTFFVVMQTFGVPDVPPKKIAKGPYGLFTSTDIKKLSGKVSGKTLMHVTGPRWTDFKEGALDTDTGIFVETSE